MHDQRKSDGTSTNGWTISRYRYFFYVLLGMFLYYWIPGVLFQGLSVFAFPTWIRPDNGKVNQLLSLGMGEHISLDAAVARLLKKEVASDVAVD